MIPVYPRQARTIVLMSAGDQILRWSCSMAHRRFPADDPERRAWQDPEQVLDAIGIAPGMTFLDVGCGEGYFALPAARRVGRSGRICGIDVDPDAVARLRAQAMAGGLDRISVIAGPAEETVVCSGCADVIFYGNSLHDFRDAVKVLGNAQKMVRPGGILADLDWQAREMPFGPPPEKRFSTARASALIRSAGFRIESLAGCGPYHYLILARPTSPGPLTSFSDPGPGPRPGQ